MGLNKLSLTCIIPSTCSRSAKPNLNRCINSLLNASRVSDVELKIVIVTNGKRLFLRGLRKHVKKILKVSGEFSFAGMNNYAINFVLTNYSDDWILLINDDARVGQDYFSVFRREVFGKKYDLVNGLVYLDKSSGDSKKIDSFGIEYFKSGYARNSQQTKIYSPLATASVLLARVVHLKIMMEKYGYVFSPILKSYFEDVDFSIRSLGIGAKIVKKKNLLAFHIGSYSTGKKSKYVLRQSYKNILIVMVLTWPLKHILGNLIYILIVQLWFVIYSTFKYGPLFYVGIISEIFTNRKLIIAERRVAISSYRNSFDLGNFFGPYIFRTRNGYPIKI